MSDAPARIQTPYLVPEDELDRSLRPRTLDEFVGQATLREQLAVAIEASPARGAARPRQDLAGADRRRRAGRAVRADGRAGPGAQGRHRGVPDGPRAPQRV